MLYTIAVVPHHTLASGNSLFLHHGRTNSHSPRHRHRGRVGKSD